MSFNMIFQGRNKEKEKKEKKEGRKEDKKKERYKESQMNCSTFLNYAGTKSIL